MKLRDSDQNIIPDSLPLAGEKRKCRAASMPSDG